MDTPVTDDFWSSLDPVQAGRPRGAWHPALVARGHAIWHVGQIADRVLVLRAGRVKVSRPWPDGREVVLAFNGPGELIGEVAALDGGVRSASVVALEPVEVLSLTPGEFRTFLAAHPSAALALITNLGRRLRYADAKLMEFASFDTLGRVAIRLTELCERFGQRDGDHVDVVLPLSQEELAGWACASLESVARAPDDAVAGLDRDPPTSDPRPRPRRRAKGREVTISDDVLGMPPMT